MYLNTYVSIKIDEAIANSETYVNISFILNYINKKFFFIISNQIRIDDDNENTFRINLVSSKIQINDAARDFDLYRQPIDGKTELYVFSYLNNLF